MGKIVDVFRGAGEMEEFTDRLEFPVPLDFILEEILDSLYVVIGGVLNLLDACRVTQRKLFDDRVQVPGRIFTQDRYLGDRLAAGECLQPFNLDQHTVAHKTEFAENRPE